MIDPLVSVTSETSGRVRATVILRSVAVEVGVPDLCGYDELRRIILEAALAADAEASEEPVILDCPIKELAGPCSTGALGGRLVARRPSSPRTGQ